MELEEKESSGTPSPDNVRGCFYSVFAPNEIEPKGIEVCKYIFSDEAAAMKLVKETKKARFRKFEFYQDAVNFATHGLIEQLKPIQRNETNNKYNSNTCHGVGEKMSPFKGPKSQDLVKLRKAIESGDYALVKHTIWDNPRYLVSSGDTPSILQEGSRINALHVAAKTGNAPIADLILTTISDEKFIKLLYGDESSDNTDIDINGRIHTLLDLYLNTPNRGINETPLHFAVKVGAWEVVEVLVSFPQCDKTLRNKFDQTPDMIICDMYKGTDVSPIRKKISSLLKNEYYVPVLRSEDNSTVPVIGEPFSPGRAHVKCSDVLSPRMEIHAYAGPLNREGAEQFRKLWKTPTRTTTSNAINDPLVSLRYTDPAKGLERHGQRLANKFDVTWKEFWPFLDCFVDITTPEGLAMLESYLADCARPLDQSRGLYDSFNEEKKSNLSTISDLCKVFQACNLIDLEDVPDLPADDSFNPFLYVEKACDVFANRLVCDITNKIIKDIKSAGMSVENQFKQLQLLIGSYSDDPRFKRVDFRAFHVRLAHLTAVKITIDDNSRNETIQKLDDFLYDFMKGSDLSSSDDERCTTSKVTAVKKQVVCVMTSILETLDAPMTPRLEVCNENDCAEVWGNCKTCSCVFNLTKPRKNGRRGFVKIRRLLFNAKDLTQSSSSSSSCDSDDDDFYTPPQSPNHFLDQDDDDDFAEVRLLPELFIEGDLPSKTDCAVLNALKYSDTHIDPNDYPNIYRWLHNVTLYPENERARWADTRLHRDFVMKSHQNHERSSPTTPSTPVLVNQHHLLDEGLMTTTPPVLRTTPSRSWLRIIGVNSPKR